MMRGSRRVSSTHPHAFRPYHVTLAAVALLLLARVAPALADCPNLQVPAGNTLAFHVYAVGAQTYRWDGATWSAAGPEAVLYADPGGHAAVGIHYAGPAGPTRPVWQSASGSKVVGMVLERCTQDPASIPWLLLGAESSEGPGVFDRVTYIQRVNTIAGNAPTVPGSVAGEIARVPYNAEYLFYKAGR